MVDHAIRAQALDPKSSFIVQAPAGSGKTELLTQRFLALLLTVKEPEEILAVTFTRKAASEMRQRIIERLSQSEAAKRNEVLEWRLIENPNRLRIMTIDALCAMIAHQMPILSQSGGKYEIASDPTLYYEEAIENLLVQTTAEEPWYEALKIILLHFDNKIENVKRTLALLLSKREQWLIYLADFQRDSQAIKSYFQTLLTRVANEHIIKTQAHFPKEIYVSLITLLTEIEVLSPEWNIAFQKSILKGNELSEPALASEFSEVDQASFLECYHLAIWKKISAILLTKEDQWRKQFTKTTGFLSPSTTKDKVEKNARKKNIEHMQSLMKVLREKDRLRECLSEITRLPLPEGGDKQHAILQALGTLLPVLAGFLKIRFKTAGKVDFSEVTLCAFNALGYELDPTELALRFDYQIKHLLVDEYQDTSVIQFKIFERLVAGWQPGDGRSLFLVGDPMQSIYRFRGAEVNLFLRTQSKGLGGVLLQPLNLSMNFRSDEKIVNWINENFSKIFPSQKDEIRSAVEYSFAKAVRCEENLDAIKLHFLEEKVDQDVYIVDLIERLLRNPETGRLAVLVRSRNHLVELIPLLKRRKINFVAYEAEHLADRQPVIDLMTLIFAALDFTDKTAWMALLRSPLLGLTLAQLLEIVEREPEALIWDALQKVSFLPQIKSFVEKLQYWLAYRHRAPLSHWIRGLWTVLGGPQCYPDLSLQKDFEVIFECLEEFDQGGRLSDKRVFQAKIEKLYSDVIPTEQACTQAIEIMTIHKAKGLEFDTVILPHIEGTTRQQDPDLLIWQELPHADGIDLIFAVSGELYDYIRYLHKQKEKNEMARLFYVAVSRAKKSLHIIGNAENPPKGSFGEMLSAVLPAVSLEGSNPEVKKNIAFNHCLNLPKKLPNNWKLPSDFEARWQEKKEKRVTEPNFPELVSPIFRAVGTVFHRAMQWELFKRDKEIWHSILARALAREGVSSAELFKASELIIEAWEKICIDPQAQWIFDPRHTESHREWSITMNTLHGIEQIVIDFAFVDENNTRWIIDYKMVQTKDFSVDAIREKYAAQMEKYANVVSKLEKRTVKKALYLPLQQIWIEI